MENMVKACENNIDTLQNKLNKIKLEINLENKKTKSTEEEWKRLKKEAENNERDLAILSKENSEIEKQLKTFESTESRYKELKEEYRNAD